MVTFEIPVVATCIVAITDDLGGVDDRSWLLTSYLLGYVGKFISPSPRSNDWITDTFHVAIIVLSSKLSDIYGRRPLLIACMMIFLIASAACSAAQTIQQL